MKEYLFSFCICFVCWLYPCTMFATGQEADIINIEGKTWELLNVPLELLDSVSYERIMQKLPKKRVTSTSNWRGYVAYWTLRGNRLYLDKISSGPIILSKDTLKSLLPFYAARNGVFAGWCTANLRVGRGKVIRYEHMGFDRDMEEQQYIVIEGGIQIYRASTPPPQIVDGTKLDFFDLGDKLAELFPFEQFPDIKYGFRVRMSDMKVDEKGQLLSVTVGIDYRKGKELVYLTDQNHPMIIKMREILVSLSPWEVFDVSGKYRMEEYSHYFGVMRDKI